MCGTTAPHRPLVRTPSLADGSEIRYFECSHCGGVLADPPDIHDYGEIFGAGDALPKHYCEVGAGLWEMYWPVAMATSSKTANLLDVGCGFGYIVDAWRTVRGGAVGVELAPYGPLGAKALGVEMYHEFLRDCQPLAGRRFDVVYASEVIEHVPDPEGFVRELSGFLADDGVMALTTPNGNFIRAHNDSPTLLAALSPGFHGFLYSPAQLKATLESAGLTHVVVREYGERLVVWGSRMPMQVGADQHAVRAEYLQYMREAVARLAPRGDLVADGLLYRLLRDCVHSGQFDEAQALRAQLEHSITAKYRAHDLAPHARIDEGDAALGADPFLRYPAFLPNYWYLCAVLDGQRADGQAAALEGFAATWQWTLQAVERWGSAPFLEALSLVWPARFRAFQLAAQQGRFDDAAAFVQALCSTTRGHAPMLTDDQRVPMLNEIVNRLGTAQRTQAFAQVLPPLERWLFDVWARGGVLPLPVLTLAISFVQALWITGAAPARCREWMARLRSAASAHQPFSPAGKQAAALLNLLAKLEAHWNQELARTSAAARA